MNRDIPWLIIDDVATACARMSDLGRSIAEPASRELHDYTVDLCRRRGWTIVSHAQFAGWALQVVRATPLEWCVLDPLFPCEQSENMHRVRVSRSLQGFDATAISTIDAM